MVGKLLRKIKKYIMLELKNIYKKLSKPAYKNQILLERNIELHKSHAIRRLIHLLVYQTRIFIEKFKLIHAAFS